MKQKPLLISLLISLGTGVIAGFLTFTSMEQYQEMYRPPIVAAGVGIPSGLAASLCTDGNCCIQNIHERSKSRSIKVIPDSAGDKLLMADTFL